MTDEGQIGAPMEDKRLLLAAGEFHLDDESPSGLGVDQDLLDGDDEP